MDNPKHCPKCQGRNFRIWTALPPASLIQFDPPESWTEHWLLACLRCGHTVAVYHTTLEDTIAEWNRQ